MIITVISEDHFKTPQEFLNLSEDVLDANKQNNVFFEGAFIEKLIDESLIPKTGELACALTQEDNNNECDCSVVAYLQDKFNSNPDNSKLIPFDVRSILQIPVSSNLSTILTNVILLQGIESYVRNFLDEYFYNNLLNPCVPYLNVLAKYRDQIPVDKYNKVIKYYHELIDKVQDHKNAKLAAFFKLMQTYDTNNLIHFWKEILNEVIFDFPAQFTDLNLLALIIKQIENNEDCVLVCGQAHAENVIEKLNEIYKDSHTITRDSIIKNEDSESEIKNLKFEIKSKPVGRNSSGLLF